jgi:hypothetical protein
MKKITSSVLRLAWQLQEPGQPEQPERQLQEPERPVQPERQERQEQPEPEPERREPGLRSCYRQSGQQQAEQQREVTYSLGFPFRQEPVVANIFWDQAKPDQSKIISTF